MAANDLAIAQNLVPVPSGSPVQGAGPSKSVLIVEDNPEVLKLLEFLMAEEGYAVKSATGVADALRLLYAFTPEVVLMDIELWTDPCATTGMTGMDGLELTRLIKLSEEYVKVIAVSARDSGAAKQEAYDAGCDGYITKPVDARTFAASVQQCLDHA